MSTIATGRPAESLHWYALDGSPAYEIKGANGNMRPCTLRDARKLNLVPSVTSIIRCAAAPGLEHWKQEQVLHAALTLPRIDGETESDLLRRIWDDSRQQGKDAAERGTAIHASLQGHYEGKPPPVEHWPHVKDAQMSISLQFPEALEWIPEASFAHPSGFGGKCDLHCKQGVVLDFKTKEFGPNNLPRLWDEHSMQLAAYRVGLGLPHAKCAIVYVSVTNPGLTHICDLTEADLAKGWDCFRALLAFWQAKNGYRPMFEEQAA